MRVFCIAVWTAIGLAGRTELAVGVSRQHRDFTAVVVRDGDPLAAGMDREMWRARAAGSLTVERCQLAVGADLERHDFAVWRVGFVDRVSESFVGRKRHVRR